MKDKRVLFVSSEVIPYLPETEISSMSFETSKIINSKGGQIRIFMPRYGNINERRHQLHEVIRLSGMNLVINDIDMPLIIKVASIPKERMQVYFIENDEYFKRKATYTNEEDELFEDNDERALFFAKGVIETVKKINWSPDIIHVHGWMASLLPLYLRKYYKTEPLFENSKIVTSVYNQGFEGSLNNKLSDKIVFDGINKKEIIHLKEPTFVNLMKSAVHHSDAVIEGSETISDEIKEFVKKSNKPVLKYHKLEDMSEAYFNFCTQKLLTQK